MILFEFLNHSGQDATAVDNNEHNAEVIFKQLDILGLFHLRIKSIFVSQQYFQYYMEHGEEIQLAESGKIQVILFLVGWGLVVGMELDIGVLEGRFASR